MPYLLAPAGTPEALKAAINAGADEIYLGGSVFNARMNAANFGNKELAEAAARCKDANVKLHITLNTLISDKEFPQAMEYVSFLNEKINPDAVIVQDIGLAYEIRKSFPKLPLHASTQMRIHSHLDAEFLKNIGFTRAVLARELPAKDIYIFANSGLETEIFVHGALCVSESGGCLMSSVIGGRSGNRGECAQPCRLPCAGKNKYPLSLKDLCLAGHMEEIIGSGVTSLKIEGRMKSAEYVGGVVSVYRRLIDESRNATEEEMKTLERIFSRSGFTDGYFTGRITPSMFGTRRKEDKENTAKSIYIPPKAPKRPARITPPANEKISLPAKSDKILPPSAQKGFVLRFEGELPTKRFADKYFPSAARIDIPLARCTDKAFAPYREKISAVMPRSIFDSELAEVKKQISDAKNAGITHATVSAFYQAELCKGFFIHGDFSLNIFNSKSEKLAESLSFSSVMLSPETDGRFVRESRIALEFTGYGRIPLMNTRTCIIKNTYGCRGKSLCIGALTDRTGAVFPIISGISHTNTLYNSLPSFRLDKRKELKKSGIGLMTLLFTSENEREMEKVMSAAAGATPEFEYTRR